MRFGSFVFSISADPDQDHQAVATTMREVERTLRVFGQTILPRSSDP